MSLSEQEINRIERALNHRSYLTAEDIGKQEEDDKNFIEKTYAILRTKMDFVSAEREARKAWLRTL